MSSNFSKKISKTDFNYIKNSGILTVATIEKTYKTKNYYSIVDLKYKDINNNEKLHKVKLDFSSNVGDKIYILYNSDDSNQFIIAGTEYNSFFSVIIFIIFTIVFYILSFNLFESTEKNKFTIIILISTLTFAVVVWLVTHFIKILSEKPFQTSATVIEIRNSTDEDNDKCEFYLLEFNYDNKKRYKLVNEFIGKKLNIGEIVKIKYYKKRDVIKVSL